MGLKKVIINTCFGGYSLSEKVVLKFNKESGTNMSASEASYKIPRDNDLLIRIIEEVGVADAGGLCAELKIIEIPDDIEFVISEYDGIETLHEKHRSWF